VSFLPFLVFVFLLVPVTVFTITCFADICSADGRMSCCGCLQLLAQAAAIQHEAAQHIDRELALKMPR